MPIMTLFILINIIVVIMSKIKTDNDNAHLNTLLLERHSGEPVVQIPNLLAGLEGSHDVLHGADLSSGHGETDRASPLLLLTVGVCPYAYGRETAGLRGRENNDDRTASLIA